MDRLQCARGPVLSHSVGARALLWQVVSLERHEFTVHITGCTSLGRHRPLHFVVLHFPASVREVSVRVQGYQLP